MRKNFYAVACFFSAASLFGNPKNPQFHAGEGRVDEAGKRIEISVSDNAIIEWDSFSISAGETTRFIQPSKHSAVLNRVAGTDLSNLSGHLQANGQVYLMNPNGVIVGKEGRIDTAMFMATTLDFKNEEFLKGEILALEGDSLAEIHNLGTIQTSSGPVALAAHKVVNDGVISALGHTVSLTSGHKVLLDPTGDALLFICTDLKSEGIENSGSIEALTVQLQSDASPASLAVSHSGMIDARSVVKEGGKVFLRATEGAIEMAASGTVKGNEITLHSEADQCRVRGTIEAPGGRIEVLGKQVGLFDRAKIDVSHEKGGGVVLVGGDEKGRNPKVPNAAAVFVDKEVEICADATQKGHGGKVIFWGDRSNIFLGTASAQGGPEGGDGGFAEISSPGSLVLRGLAKTLAPKGRAGTLLLDPTNVCIDTPSDANWTFNPTTLEYNFTGSSASTPCTPTMGGVVIPASSITANLANGNVTIDTSAMTDQGQAGNINVNEDIVWDAANTLTLNASNNISMNGITISNPTPSSLSLLSLTYSGNLNLNDGTVWELYEFPFLLFNCNLNGSLTFIGTSTQSALLILESALTGDTTVTANYLDVVGFDYITGAFDFTIDASASSNLLVGDIGNTITGAPMPVQSANFTAGLFLTVTDGIETAGGPITLSTYTTKNPNTAIILQNVNQLSVTPGLLSPITITTGCLEIWANTTPFTTTITTDGNVTVLAAASAYFTIPGVIESTGAGGLVTLVADEFFSSPTASPIAGTNYVFGFGSQVMTPTLTLSTGLGGQVQLYTAVAGINAFPTVINGTAYTPGVFNTSSVYTFGTNEYLGYWYPELPPADPPPFLVMYKSLYVPTPPVNTIVTTAIALTEPTTASKTEMQAQPPPIVPNPTGLRSAQRID